MEQVQGRPWKGKKHNSTWYPQLDSGQALISCYYVSYDSYDTYIFYFPQMCKRCPGPNYNILSYIVNHDTFIVNIFQVYTSSAEEALRMSIFAQNVAKVKIIVLMMKKNIILEKREKKSLHGILLGRSLLVWIRSCHRLTNVSNISHLNQIEAQNRAGQSWKSGINQFTDLTK